MQQLAPFSIDAPYNIERWRPREVLKSDRAMAL